MNDLIEKLSNLRSQFNCFDENEHEAYHALSEVIKVLSEQPEPCEDAVSRRRLLSDLKELVVAWEKYPVMVKQIKGVETAIKYVELIPSVTPKRKKGKWIEEQRGIKVTQYKCSECGRTVIDDTTYDVAEDYPFCHCGADMRQREESK